VFINGEIQIIKPDIGGIRESAKAGMKIIERDGPGRFGN